MGSVLAITGAIDPTVSRGACRCWLLASATMTDTERHPPLHVAEDTQAEFMQQLTSGLRAGLDSPTPSPLLVTASMLLSITAGGSDRSAATATFVRRLSRVP